MNVSNEAWESFQVYVNHEDWASETEKTDFTYSPLSRYRNEIIPGFPNRPNLRRSPLRAPRTSELEEERQFRKRYLRNVQRTTLFSNTDVIDNGHIEQKTFYSRTATLFFFIWSSIVNTSLSIIEWSRLKAFLFSSAFAGSIISIWSWNARAVSSVATRVGYLWRRLFQRELSVQSQGSQGTESYYSAITKIVISKFITVTTITYNLFSKSSTTFISGNAKTGRRNFWLLLLLLLPLLLIAGWFFTDEASQLSIPHNLKFLKTNFRPTIDNLSEAFISLYYSCLSFGSDAWALLQTSFSSVWVTIRNWNVFENVFSNLTSMFSVWNSFKECLIYYLYEFCNVFMTFGASAFSTFSLFFVGNSSDVTSNNVVYENFGEGELDRFGERDLDRLGDGDETSLDSKEVEKENELIAELLRRTLVLEKQVETEKQMRSIDGAKFEAALKYFHQNLQSLRLESTSTIRRCCSTPSAPSELLGNKLQQFEEQIDGLEKQYSANIQRLRDDLTRSTNNKEDHEMSLGSLDVDAVKKIANAAIRTYDADKTGRADYALESGGGRVVSIRCTKTYSHKSYSLWGIPVLWSWSKPDEAIRPGMAPGECWAFHGAVGYLALELSYPIKVTGFTVEHISRELSPMGKIDSAPKHFSMWGLKDADDIYDQYLFGDYEYADSGETIQYFPVKNPTDKEFKFVELKIYSNHGHPDYTCLYRIRVHGNV